MIFTLSQSVNERVYRFMAVLEASKRLTFDFHYNFVMKQFGPTEFELCFTDTDSLLYHVKVPGNALNKLYTDNFDFFDTVDHPRDH